MTPPFLVFGLGISPLTATDLPVAQAGVPSSPVVAEAEAEPVQDSDDEEYDDEEYDDEEYDDEEYDDEEYDDEDAEQSAPTAAPSPQTTVTFETNRPGHTIALVPPEVVQTMRVGKHESWVSAAMAPWKLQRARLAPGAELCQAPCTVALPSGSHVLSVYGNGVRPGTDRVDIPPTSDALVEVRTGSNFLRGAGYALQWLSFTSAALGGQLWLWGKLEEDYGFESPLARTGAIMFYSGLAGYAGGVTLSWSQQSSLRIVPSR